MNEAHAEDIKKHVRAYIGVFVALALLTVLTVFVSYLDFSRGGHITIALLIAVVKAGLVASYFMHLISEKKLIYGALILTVLLFAALMFLTLSSHMDQRGI